MTFRLRTVAKVAVVVAVKIRLEAIGRESEEVVVGLVISRPTAHTNTSGNGNVCHTMHDGETFSRYSVLLRRA
jgi:hypothetical protein